MYQYVPKWGRHHILNRLKTLPHPRHTNGNIHMHRAMVLPIRTPLAHTPFHFSPS